MAYTLPFPESPMWDLTVEIRHSEQAQSVAGRFFQICSAGAWAGFDSGIWSWIWSGWLVATLGDVYEELGEAEASVILEDLLEAAGPIPDTLLGLGIDVLAQAFQLVQPFVDAGELS